jgi:hypothetical protein
MKRVVFALIVVLMTAGIANAGVEVLTFQGLLDNEQVLNYYNGGLGGSGSGPGPSYGIVFGTDSIVAISAAAGGSENNYNQPSGSNSALYFLSGPGDIMNVAAGFTTGFSFYESGPVGGTVMVYSGLNDTGTVLASLSLPATPQGSTDGGIVNGYYSVWTPVGVTFSGTAESVDFSGTANEIAFDAITLGSSTPNSAPEPVTLLFLGPGLVGLAAMKRRFKK